MCLVEGELDLNSVKVSDLSSRYLRENSKNSDKWNILNDK